MSSPAAARVSALAAPLVYTGSAGLQITVPAGVSTIAAIGGPAVALTKVTASLPFQQITSTNSATTGVDLTIVAGTVTAGNTSSITNATGTDFNVFQSNATVTYDGSITDNTGSGVKPPRPGRFVRLRYEDLHRRNQRHRQRDRRGHRGHQ